MKLTRSLASAFAGASIFAAAFAAQAANVITGDLWHVPEAVTLNAVPANIPATTPDVVFDVLSPLNFSGTSATVGTWLSSGSAFNIVENTPNTLTSLMDNGTVGSILRFTGQVSVVNGQMFTVTHDDGLTLIIGGVNLNFSPGPTSPITSIATYSGPTGTFNFDLVYAECCGGPAVLQVDLPFTNAVPEPDSYAMLLAGLGMVGFIARRRKKSA